MFGWLKRKIRQKELHSNLSSAFDRIRDDLSVQRKTIEGLSSSHLELRKNTHSNHQRIADWIRHVDSSIQRLETDIIKLEAKVYDDLHLSSEASAKHVSESLENQKRELSALKESLKRELEVFLSESKLKPPIINV